MNRRECGKDAKRSEVPVSFPIRNTMHWQAARARSMLAMQRHDAACKPGAQKISMNPLFLLRRNSM